MATENEGQGHDEAVERLVERYVERVLKGRPLGRPILVKGADGRCRPLDELDRARLLAAVRCGLKEVKMLVIEDPGPDELEVLRRKLRAVRGR